MTISYIGVGSNVGNKPANCRRAIGRMGNLAASRVEAVSDFYRTEPVGVENQDWYVNAVAILDTRMTARELLEALLAIEKKMGRKRTERWAPRVIDLDILLYGTEVIQEPDLVVPHPRMHLRRFTLVPMALLAPDLTHPLLGQTMAGLLQNLSADRQAVVPLRED